MKQVWLLVCADILVGLFNQVKTELGIKSPLAGVDDHSCLPL